MAIRCLARARLGVGSARALGLRSLAVRALSLMVFRAVDLAAVLRAGDFFCAAVRLAARDVGFCLAIDVLPSRFEGRGYHKSQFVGWAKRKRARRPASIMDQGGHASLCPPYKTRINATGTRRRWCAA